MRSGTVAALLLAAFALIPTRVEAQATTGRISGTVKDQSGGVLPGVTVTASERQTGFSRNAVTDGEGSYVFVNLPLGDYSVSAELSGFRKAVRSGYVLDADARLTADFELAVGELNEAVLVVAHSETVNLTSGEIAHVVDRDQV